MDVLPPRLVRPRGGRLRRAWGARRGFRLVPRRRLGPAWRARRTLRLTPRRRRWWRHRRDDAADCCSDGLGDGACELLEACDGCDGCDALDCGGADCGSCLLALVLVLWCLPWLGAVAVAGHPEGRAVGAVRVYQRRISARRPACCRFTPSCSAYAVEALQRHGLRRGLVLTRGRLRRCRPGGARGADPVPRRPASTRG